MTDVDHASQTVGSNAGATGPGDRIAPPPGSRSLLPGWAAAMGVVGGLGSAGVGAFLMQRALTQPAVVYVVVGFALIGVLSGVVGVLVGVRALRVLRASPAFGLVTAGGTVALCAAFLFLATNRGTIGNHHVTGMLMLLAGFGLLCAGGGALAIVTRTRDSMVYVARGMVAATVLGAAAAGAWMVWRSGWASSLAGGAKAFAVVGAVLGSLVLVGLVSYAGHALIRAFEIGTDAASDERPR